MSKIKLLVSETVVYGISTILVRFLNWMLMPYYIRKMVPEDYGVITYFYSIMALLLVLLTFGMETGFFRFAKEYDYRKVLSTSISSVGIVSLLFIIFCTLFITPIQHVIDVPVTKSLIFVNVFCLAVDAFTSIIFAKYRYENKTSKYFWLRILNVVVGLGFTVLYLDVFPAIHYSSYSFLVDWFFSPDKVVYYSFLANLLGSLSVLFFVKVDLIFEKYFIDFALLKKMLVYSLPMLGVGITGMINLNLDKLLLPHLLNSANSLKDLAVYGANFKIGLLMAMFAQSFRMAFEPFCFKYSDQSNIKIVYADVLKYFTIFGVFIFLGVTLYIDVINLFLTSDYISGGSVVPLILFSQLLSGIFYSQSLWYKLSDRPIFGLYLGFIGALVTILLNIFFVPIYGYIASAWASLICYAVMVIVSYLFGHHFYPIPYQVFLITFYIGFGFLLYYLSIIWSIDNFVLRIIRNTFLLFTFISFVLYKEKFYKLILRYVYNR